ncbi:hypothetical protein [Streptomyces sp. NPDC001070]
MGAFGYVCVTFLCWAGAGISVRSAWLAWHDSPRFHVVPGSRFHPFDPSRVRGHKRGLVPWAGISLGAGLCLTGGFLIGWFEGVTVAAGSILTALGVLMSALGFGLHLTILWFNRPRFLVPPHLRDDPGTMIEWRRHRKELRASLREAARRP